MKDFIYFFKHKNITGIKIGRASGSSINDRFCSFKTYSPFGAEIIGFFECDNCVKTEAELHKRFATCRMNGEFFDISEDIVKSIINTYDTNYHEIKILFNEWISNPENNIIALKSIFKKAADKINDIDHFIKNKISPGTIGDSFLTADEICKMFDVDFGKRISHRLSKNGFISTKRRDEFKIKRGYYVKVLYQN